MKIFTNRVLIVAALTLSAALVFAQGGGGAGGGRQGGRQGGGFGGGFGQRGGAFGQNEMTLAMRADVQTDLGVTPEQKTKLEALQAKQREARRGQGGRGAGGAGGVGAGGAGGAGGGAGGGQGGARQGGGQGGNFDPAAMQERMAQQRAENRKALGEILNEGQMKRLDEISIQLRGNRALMDAEVQKALGMSTDQVNKLRDLQAKQQEANRAIFEKVRNQEISREEAQASQEKNNKILDEELGKVLTSDQASKFKAMQGKPFKADPNQNNRGGRGGG